MAFFKRAWQKVKVPSRPTKGWKVIICIETTPYVNVTNFDKNGLDVFFYIPLSPNHIKKLELQCLNDLKLNLYP